MHRSQRLGEVRDLQLGSGRLLVILRPIVSRETVALTADPVTNSGELVPPHQDSGSAVGEGGKIGILQLRNHGAGRFS